MRSLDVLSEQNEDATLGWIIEDLAGKLGQGFAFSKALSLYPRVFPGMMVHLVAKGESTGLLVKVIHRLSELLETEENLVKQVRGALSYPIFILVLTLVLAGRLRFLAATRSGRKIHGLQWRGGLVYVKDMDDPSSERRVLSPSVETIGVIDGMLSRPF